MKNFSGFKYQKSVLRTVEEPPVKKKFNWDRFFFIIALTVIASYFLNNLYNNVLYVSVDGLVIMDKTDIHFTEDIRLGEFYVEEGDPVSKGDTLFRYRFEDNEAINGEINSLKMQSKLGAPDNWFLKERLNTNRQIAIKVSEQEGIRSNMRIKQKELEEQKKLILLGVDIAYKLPPLEAELARLIGELAVSKEEIKIFKKHLQYLQQEEKLAQSRTEEQVKKQIAEGYSIYNKEFYCLSPIEGLIGRIYKSPLEVTYESEEVMVVHQLENLKVKAYFDQASYNEITIGDEVMVEFPDGKRGKGIIYNFYVSTYPLPPEFQKKYEPVRRSIVADIIPANEKEAAHWSKYYKMAVKVHKQQLLFDRIF